MKIQDALNTIDEMITHIECAQESIRNRSSCIDREYYIEMDANHTAQIDRYRALRDAIERGLEY